jgi:hypothetical protein
MRKAGEPRFWSSRRVEDECSPVPVWKASVPLKVTTNWRGGESWQFKGATGPRLTERDADDVDSAAQNVTAFALGKVNDTFLEMRVVVVSSPKPTQRIIETLLPRRFIPIPDLLESNGALAFDSSDNGLGTGF